VRGAPHGAHGVCGGERRGGGGVREKKGGRGGGGGRRGGWGATSAQEGADGSHAPSLTDARHSPFGEKRTAFTVFMWPVSVNINSTPRPSSGAGPAGGAAEEPPPPPPLGGGSGGGASINRQIFTSLSAPAVAKTGSVGWKSRERRGSFLDPVFACHVIWSVLARKGMVRSELKPRVQRREL
jgi:hypothetical protein